LIEVVIFKGDEATIRGFIQPGTDPRSNRQGFVPTLEQAALSSANGIATTEIYSRSRNSVNGLTFEIDNLTVKVKPMRLISGTIWQELSEASRKLYAKLKVSAKQ